MPRRTDIDWEAVERDFRLGQMSGREIAKKHGIANSALRNKVKKEGWTADLSQTVRVATKAALIEDQKARAQRIGADVAAKSAEEAHEEAQKDESAVHAAVSENLRVINKHLSAAKESRDIVDMLKAEILDESVQKDEYIKMGELMDESHFDDNGNFKKDKVNEQYQKAISLPARVKMMKELVETEAKLKDIQRQALNIDDAKGGDGSWEEALIAIGVKSA